MLSPTTLIQGRYRIAEKIGSDATGMLYKAIDELSGLPVVLKQVTLSAAASAELEHATYALPLPDRASHPAITNYVTTAQGQFLVLQPTWLERPAPAPKRRWRLRWYPQLGWLVLLLPLLVLLYAIKRTPLPEVPIERMPLSAANVARLQPVQTLTLSSSYADVLALDWVADGNALGTIDSSTHVYLWDADGSYVQELDGFDYFPTALGWGQQAQLDQAPLAVGDWGGTVRIWRTLGGVQTMFHVRRTMDLYHYFIVELEWNASNELLAALADNGAICVWTYQGVRQECWETGVRQWSSVRSALAWSPDGQTLAWGDATGSIHFWRADGDGWPTIAAHAGPVQSLAWSSTGQLATGGEDAVIKLWQPQSGQLLHTLSGHSSAIYELFWSRDGSRLLASTATALGLWDASGAQLRMITVAPDAAYLVDWHPDGQLFALGFADGRINVFDADGQGLATLAEPTAALHALAWSPDGRTLATGGTGAATLWSVDAVQPTK